MSIFIALYDNLSNTYGVFIIVKDFAETVIECHYVNNYSVQTITKSNSFHETE